MWSFRRGKETQSTMHRGCAEKHGAGSRVRAVRAGREPLLGVAVCAAAMALGNPAVSSAQTTLLPQEHPGNVPGKVLLQTAAYNYAPPATANPKFALTTRGIVTQPQGGKEVTWARCLNGNVTTLEVTFDAVDGFGNFRPVTYSWGSLFRDGVRLSPPYPDLAEFRIDRSLPINQITPPNTGWTYMNGGSSGPQNYTVSGGAAAGYPFVNQFAFSGSMPALTITDHPGGTITGSVNVFCPSQCEDGVENEYLQDGTPVFDGVADRLDPGCWDNPNDPTTYNARRNSEGGGTTQCQDSVDNDGDGVIDRLDPGCWSTIADPASYDRTRNNEGSATTQCQDTVDNDADGLIDRSDIGCWRNPADPASYDRLRNSETAGTTQCQDTVDNDGDALVDRLDPGCWSNPADPASYDRTRNDESAATSQCRDALDNDGDGLADRLDPGCWSNPANPATYDSARNNEGAATTQCQDAVDNDADGVIDRLDPGCWSNPADAATYDRLRNNEGAATTQCQDSRDNDGDALTDAADPGCWSNRNSSSSYLRTLNNEGAGTTQCQDGIDNDSDTLKDSQDPGCWLDITAPGSYDRTRDNEAAATTQCQDGKDNDGDGAIDKLDPGCWASEGNPASYNPALNDESKSTTQCQDGKDNDNDGLADRTDPGCWSNPSDPNTYNRVLNNEGSATTQCQDGKDNDADALVDKDDPGCWANATSQATYDAKRNSEAAATTQCQDGKDNDGDAVADKLDPGCWTDPKNSATYDPKRNDEVKATTQCQDNVDNDGDIFVDRADPGCWTDPNNSATYDRTRNNEGAATGNCRDGIDNDKDGFKDGEDPGCWKEPFNPASYDPSIVSEVHTDLRRLSLTGSCVFDNKNGTYTAYFSYANTASREIVVKNSPLTPNAFSPGNPDRGQPTTFLIGEQPGAFALVFDGKPVTWTIKPVGGVKVETTVSAQTTACKPLVPRAECIGSDAQGFTATMGYLNPNSFPVAIPKGPNNVIEPATSDGAQPQVFVKGDKVAAFVVRFKDALSWTLTGTKAQVTAATPLCSGTCVETPIGTVTAQVDATATKLAQVVKRAADKLYAQAKKSRSATLMRKARVDGQRALSKANAYIAEVQKLTIAFPAVVKSCPTLTPFCQSVDRSAAIAALKAIYLKLADSTARFAARTDFKGSGSTNRTNALIKEAKALRDQGLVEIAKLPVTATECK